MTSKKGFTLLEVLVVVVIAASVLLFAVPAYKRTQDKSMFLAAQGLLVDLRASVQSIRQDLAMAGSNHKIPSGSSPIKLTASWQDESAEEYSEAANVNFLKDLESAKLPYALFARQYMQPVAFDPTTDQYKRYTFYICPQEQASSAHCCNSDKNVIACMQDANYCNRPTRGQYYGALIMRDGTITVIERSDCTSEEEEEEEGADEN